MKRNWFAVGVVLALAVGMIGAPQARAKPADLPSQNDIECPDGSDGQVKGEFGVELEIEITARGITFKGGVKAAKAEPPMSIDTLCPALLPACVEQLFQFVNDAVTIGLRRQAEAERVAQARALVEVRMFEPVNVRIKNVPLKQALKNLAQASGVRIVPDQAALEDAKINLDHAVSLAMEDTSLHTALQQLLNPLKLTFEIENDVVMVTTPDRGRGRTKADRDLLTKTETAQRLFEMAERHRRANEYDMARHLYQQVHLLTPTTLHGRVAIVRIIELEDRLRDVSEEQGIPGRSDVDPEEMFRDMQGRTVPLGLVDVSY